MDERKDLEKGSQPRSNNNAELQADQNDTTAEATVENEPGVEGENFNGLPPPIFEFTVLDFIATQDGVHELRETSYKTSSEFSQVLNSHESSPMRHHSTGDSHQVLVVTARGHVPDADTLDKTFATLEPYLHERKAAEESRGFLRQFLGNQGPTPLADREFESHFWLYWRRNSPTTETKSLPAAAHYKGRYPTRFVIPMDKGSLKRVSQKMGWAIQYALGQQVCCISMPHTIILIHAEGFVKYWAVQEPNDGDPPRRSVAQALVAGLRRFDRQSVSISRLFRSLQASICQILLDDEWKVLCQMDIGLTKIDRNLFASDWMDVKKLDSWILTRWRTYLYYTRHELIMQLTGIIKAAADPGETTERDLQTALRKFELRAEGVLRHFESTFNASIGTMSFIESTKAIQTADQVKKLTQLAFCFIPLSFVCGIFGMNVHELADVSLWTWAATSASLLLIVYFVLYAGAIWHFIKIDFLSPFWRFVQFRILWHLIRWRPDDWPHDF